MKLKLPLIAAFSAMLSLTACGGGSGGADNTPVYSVVVDSSLKITDNVVGTGAVAAAGKTAYVTYTGWLYDATKPDHKGTQFDSGPYNFLVGGHQVIPGFEQTVYNMKVGGKRTVEIPSRLGYGPAGSPPRIPANADLVFEITLTNVQ